MLPVVERKIMQQNHHAFRGKFAHGRMAEQARNSWTNDSRTSESIFVKPKHEMTRSLRNSNRSRLREALPFRTIDELTCLAISPWPNVH